ncbi:lipoate--protein ligase family protein [Kocuria coralli]|uniref:Lipoate--protein ligase family protein n=1 Tax=Kocuria coralli TaxID=1461025 RepID=A0A5J5KW90_9MICC|nr:biotin/lipoate A/B protein ligase family protein [Kocuria coralli]KAA9393772.1 lipoate--protein ligase family protein [Kocuria coralli]
MHGEYKVRGGKLVVVDLEVSGSAELATFKDVVVSGDFFLEPDDAFEDLNAALEGLPATMSAEGIARAVEARFEARADEVRMIGFDADAVGIAVRRAVGTAKSWSDLDVEVIPMKTLDPALHVALDEVLAHEMAAGRRGPTLRFWDWDDALVVIGSYQSVRNEVDLEAAREQGVGVTRRITGGGAMFMEPGNCVTYSLMVPAGLVEGLSPERAYAFLDEWVLGALERIGVRARYVPLNDITTDQGKIGGAAQRRFADGTLLHHVTMSYDIDADKMLQVLRIGREKLSDKGIKSAKKRVDPMRSQTGMAREAIIESFREYFLSTYRSHEGDYRPGELEAAQEAVRSKFATERWTHRVP